MTADGELRSLTIEENRETFEGAVVALGGLGVVTRVTLATEPAFAMQQYVYEDMASVDLYEHFDEVMSSAYSVSLFPDWQDGTCNQVWLKHRTGLLEEIATSDTPSSGTEPAQDTSLGQRELYGAKAAQTDLHPVTNLSPDGLTPQMGVPGPWHDRLPHFSVDSTPASGDELQTEYFVPRVHAVPALKAVEGLRDRFKSLLWISEVRSVAADRLWLSQSYGTPTIGIHFSWRKNWPALREVLPVVEEALSPYEVRPHWGKLFTLAPAQVQAAYSKLDQFRSLLQIVRSCWQVFATGIWIVMYLGSGPGASWESVPFCQEPFSPMRRRGATRNRNSQQRSAKVYAASHRSGLGNCSRDSRNRVTDVVRKQTYTGDQGRKRHS